MDKIDSNIKMINDSNIKDYLINSNKKSNFTANKNLQNTNEVLNKTYQQLSNNLENDIFELVTNISSVSFQKLVVDLLWKMGYGSFENSGKRTSKRNTKKPDYIVMEDKLGFNLIHILAKKLDNNESIECLEIQNLVETLPSKLTKGLFVTIGNFSKEAIEYANSNNVILINGEKLVKLMVENNFCVKTKKVFEIKEIDSEQIRVY